MGNMKDQTFKAVYQKSRNIANVFVQTARSTASQNNMEKGFNLQMQVNIKLVNKTTAWKKHVIEESILSIFLSLRVLSAVLTVF